MRATTIGGAMLRDAVLPPHTQEGQMQKQEQERPTNPAATISVAELRRRAALLTEITLMTDESFGYIVSAALQLDQYVNNGGFSPDSRESFTKVVNAADSYARGK